MDIMKCFGKVGYVKHIGIYMRHDTCKETGKAITVLESDTPFVIGVRPVEGKLEDSTPKFSTKSGDFRTPWTLSIDGHQEDYYHRYFNIVKFGKGYECEFSASEMIQFDGKEPVQILASFLSSFINEEAGFSGAVVLIDSNGCSEDVSYELDLLSDISNSPLNELKEKLGKEALSIRFQAVHDSRHYMYLNLETFTLFRVEIDTNALLWKKKS